MVAALIHEFGLRTGNIALRDGSLRPENLHAPVGPVARAAAVLNGDRRPACRPEHGRRSVEIRDLSVGGIHHDFAAGEHADPGFARPKPDLVEIVDHQVPKNSAKPADLLDGWWRGIL